MIAQGDEAIRSLAEGVEGSLNLVDGRVLSVESGHPIIANARGIKADGVTDDTAAWQALIATLTDGQAVTWVGNSVVQPGLSFIARVALLGQGLRSAFTIAGGNPLLDGIIFGGTDGLRWFHQIRDFSIHGAAGCCNRALVLRNLLDPAIENVLVKAGATGHGVSIEGMQNAKRVGITVTNNTSGAFAGTRPAHGFRIVGSVLIPTNANRLVLVAEGLAGDGVVGDGTVGFAGGYNNYLSGVVQGNGGKGVSLKNFTDGGVHDCHIEGNTGDDLTLDTCGRMTLGPALFVDGNTKLVASYDTALDGLTTTALSIDVATIRTLRRLVVINGGTDTDASTLTSVASAATIAVPKTARVVQVTGTTTTDNITATFPGHVVTLLFTGAQTVTDSIGNISLAGAFTHAANATLTLFCDGTNWREIARSAN